LFKIHRAAGVQKFRRNLIFQIGCNRLINFLKKLHWRIPKAFVKRFPARNVFFLFRRLPLKLSGDFAAAD
jgi:hypothetical protein